MSRHIFDAAYQDHPIRITVGYDRPSGSFYLHIGWVSAKTGKVFAYASDLKPAYDPKDWKSIRGYLDQLHIVAPASVWIELAYDFVAEAGNRVVKHSGDGRIDELIAW